VIAGEVLDLGFLSASVRSRAEFPLCHAQSRLQPKDLRAVLAGSMCGLDDTTRLDAT